MKRSGASPALSLILVLPFSLCSAASAQVAGSVDCRGDDGSGCSGQLSTVAVRTVPGGALQIGVLTGGPVFGMPEISQVVREEAYQAQAVTEIRQTLANGTHIDQTVTATVARDREGRTVRSQRLGTYGPFLAFHIPGSPVPGSADAQPPLLTTIFDPIAKEHIDFTSDAKVARVLPLLEPTNDRVFSVSDHLEDGRPATVAASLARPEESGRGQGRGMVMADGDAGPVIIADAGESAEKTEPLGKKIIEGVETRGTRRVWTLAAGAIGNDKPLITTEDTWYSSKLKLVLLSVRDDPRFGRTTYSLIDLRLTDPDKSLFRIPPGYTIEKSAPPEPHAGSPLPPQ